jgi:hypothetical protein
MPARRRFPLPWIVEELDACFVVVDCAAYVYFEDEPGRRSAAKLLTKDEARRIDSPSTRRRCSLPAFRGLPILI